MTKRDASQEPASRTHPDQTLLAGFADGALDPSARTEVVAHLVECETCFATVSMLAELDDGSDVAPPVAVRERAARLVVGNDNSRIWLQSRTVAAALFLLLGTGLLWSYLQTNRSMREGGRAPMEDVRRLRGSESDKPGPTLLSPREGQVLDGPPFVVRWTKTPDAFDYRIAIKNTEGALVWEQRVAALEIQVPADLPLTADETYFIQVEASLVEARTLPSNHVEFRIGRRR